AARGASHASRRRDATRVVVVDAASGGKPGTMRRFEAHREPLPAVLLRASTHSWGLAEAVETARALGELPPLTIVYAIFGSSFEPGTRCLSPGVCEAVARVAEALQREIPALARPSSALEANAG